MSRFSRRSIILILIAMSLAAVARISSAQAAKPQPAAAAADKTAAPETPSPEVQRAVDKAIQDRLKDSKVVEIETSERIAARLSEWAKLLGFFVGIPTAVIALILSIIGVKSYKDFKTHVEELHALLNSHVQKIEQDSKAFEERLRSANAILEKAAAVDQQLGALNQKVERIEKVVRFQKTSALTPELEKTLHKTLSDFADYLKSVGLPITPTIPTVVVSDRKQLNAYYVGGKKPQIYIHPEIAPYPDTVLREFTHHVLQELNPEMNWGYDHAGLESALADYLPASFLDNSDFGADIWPIFERHSPGLEVTSRNLENQLSFKKVNLDPGNQHANGTVWGGAYWELREQFGKETIDGLLLATWEKFDFEKSKSDLSVFPLELLQQDKLKKGGKLGKAIRAVFKKRGLEL
jgi:hypothetical protein